LHLKALVVDLLQGRYSLDEGRQEGLKRRPWVNALIFEIVSPTRNTI
jgi:hypothetical protein